MTLVIRPFEYSEPDYEQAVALYNEVWPYHHDTPELWRFYDERRVPGYLYERYVAENSTGLLALITVGQAPGSFEPGKYWVSLFVGPSFRRQGIGAALYNHVLSRLAALQPVKLTAWTSEDQEEGIAFLSKRGFQQKMRFPESELVVRDFDPAPFAGKVNEVLNSDLEIKTLTELLAEDANGKTKLYDLVWELLQDVPSPDPLTPIPFETWEQRTLGNPNLEPDGWRLALDGERYVGMTALFRNSGNEKIVMHGLTGVVRSHRRRGIATALKVLATEYARSRGYELIRTDNEENNPMYQINLSLGYRPMPAGLDFVLHLTEDV